MVDSVNSLNNSTNTNSTAPEFQTRKYVSYYVPIAPKGSEKDEVVIHKKHKKKTAASKNGQILGVVVSSVIGGVGAIVIGSLLMMKLTKLGKGAQVKDLMEQAEKANLPKPVKATVDTLIEKFKTSLINGETILDMVNNILKLPFKKVEPKIVDLKKAKAILDDELIGFDKPKEELLSLLAAKNRDIKKGVERTGPTVICLAGPAGLGKTSFAKALAKILEVPSKFIPLGQKNDAYDLIGSKSLYLNSEPGDIIAAIIETGVPNPLIVFDEVDKMGASREHGDPESILLSLFDPKQCKEFTDQRLKVPFDTSNVTYILTANEVENLSKPLRDRMTIIHLPSYTKKNKIDICQHSLPKLLQEAHIENSQIDVQPEAIEEIVKHTNDDGARSTLRYLNRILTKVKEKLELYGENQRIKIDKDFVYEALKNITNTKTMGFAPEKPEQKRAMGL